MYSNEISEQPLDLYDSRNARITELYPQPKDIADYEDAQRAAFAEFIGTPAQIETEKQAMNDRIWAELERLRNEWKAKLEAKVKAYWAAAFAEQEGIHSEILVFLHGKAYTEGHSAGETEIYSYFREYCDNYRELKKLEATLGL